MDDDPSSSVPLFRQSAEALAGKLAEIGTAESMSMAREARVLAHTFLGWEKARPANDARITAIGQLFALNRRVMDFLAQRNRARKSGA
jgi:hypothetical protein